MVGRRAIVKKASARGSLAGGGGGSWAVRRPRRASSGADVRGAPEPGTAVEGFRYPPRIRRSVRVARIHEKPVNACRLLKSLDEALPLEAGHPTAARAPARHTVAFAGREATTQQV